MRIIITLILSLAALSVSAASHIYKWKDAQGQVHYGQTLPQGVEAIGRPQSQLQPGVSIQAQQPSAAPAPAASKTITVQNAPPPESKADKAARCTAARERVTFLEERPPNRVYVVAPDGTESRMTEEQYAESLAKAKEAGKNC